MRIRKVNFEKDFDAKRVVTNHNPLENKAFTEDGIFSEEIFGNYHTSNELRRGWIDFGNNYIINPLLFPYLKKVLPKLIRIIKSERNIDNEGEEVTTSELDAIGLIKLRENFDEILEKYGDKKCEEYEYIINNRDILFTSKLPIFSSKLRPAMLINGNTIISDGINDYYNFIIKYSNELKESNTEIEGELQIVKILYNLQDYANQLHKAIIDNFLRQKKGWLRNNMMGCRINFSARNVIGPLVGYRIDAVSIPYKTYLELYKKQIINIIVTCKGISYLKANELWRQATTEFNPEIYKYMVELNKKTKDGQYILLNRNPSISVGSVLRLKIAHIKDDYDDMTLEISNNCLPSLSGDYDGRLLPSLNLFNCWKAKFKRIC
jgi:DNA-directed RNA polymerase beta' subunit